MKCVFMIWVLLGVLALAFSGCGGTRYENGVKIEKSGWFGAVDSVSETESQDS